MKEIRKIEVDGEIVNLKKDFEGWRVVYPFRNEDHSLNWKSILTNGKGWKYLLVFLLAIGVLGALYYFGMHELINAYKAPFEDPALFCRTYNKVNLNLTELTGLNYTK